MDDAEATDLNSAIHFIFQRNECVGGRGRCERVSVVKRHETAPSADLGGSSKDSAGIAED